MSTHETIGLSDEWYTPKYIFDALESTFDLDIASPMDRTFINTPARSFISNDSLNEDWFGFVWANPPFGGRNGILPWAIKFIDHGNGLLLTPDRTSAPWWQEVAQKTDSVLFVDGKIKFIKPDGTQGKQPGTGTTIFAIGELGVNALLKAQKNGLGINFLNKINNE